MSAPDDMVTRQLIDMTEWMKQQMKINNALSERVLLLETRVTELESRRGR